MLNQVQAVGDAMGALQQQAHSLGDDMVTEFVEQQCGGLQRQEIADNLEQVRGKLTQIEMNLSWESARVRGVRVLACSKSG